MLVFGLLLFILGSGLCALAANITMLVLARAIQGAGAAAAAALSLALTKDLYDGLERQKILASIGVIMAFCPMLAPTLGGLLLKFASWQWIFVSQVVVAFVALYGVSQLKEPLTEFTSGGVLSVAGRYIAVFKNRQFTVMALSFALMILPHFGFIGGSPAIYISGFGMSEQVFGLYFGANALGFMLGSMVCTRLGGVLSQLRILYISLIAIIGAGGLMLLLGGTSPLTVAIPMFCITFSVGLSRPVSNSLILDQVDKDIGAASGVMTFEMFMVGAVSMELIALDWPSKTMLLGVFAFFGGGIPLTTLLVMRLLKNKSR
ncbi:hypothetical protein PSDVSF_34190 [Pseudodesulfovibrio sediminis]|uniref:Major facilitator superfamily (MFS) profile domain-containing protein n=1 Tax=Pseudodesulfovibrio sediminis TaxID=2810563 RepID=A0ABM7PAN2_9BACT|nr:hypothetical protein PSDVSF_34190 [Pseudodesulfovibrio sediminis]